MRSVGRVLVTLVAAGLAIAMLVMCGRGQTQPAHAAPDMWWGATGIALHIALLVLIWAFNLVVIGILVTATVILLAMIVILVVKMWRWLQAVSP